MSSPNMNDGAETIQELKAAILALEWEITDEVLDSLLGALGPLQERWAEQKVLLVCLQIIGTLGQYVKAAKEKTHPDTISLLHSVFDTLDLIVTDDSMGESAKVEKVRLEVGKYNDLKKEISSSPGTIKEDKDGTEESSQEKAKDEEKPETAPAGGMPSTQPPVSVDEKEIVMERVDGEVFPEADELIDDFFAEGAENAEVMFSADDEEESATESVLKEPGEEGIIEFSADDEEEPSTETTASEESDEEEEIVEFNLTRVAEEEAGEEAGEEADADEEFRSKIEAELSERLDIGEKEEKVELELSTAETATEESPEAQEPPVAVVTPNLDAIIDSFASELAAALTEEIKKRVQEEVNQLCSKQAE